MTATAERAGRHRVPMSRGTCAVCHLSFACRQDGTLIPHGPRDERCPGQRQQAVPDAAVVLPALGRMLVSPILAALLGPRTDARRDLRLATTAIRRAERVGKVPTDLRLPVQPRERVS